MKTKWAVVVIQDKRKVYVRPYGTNRDGEKTVEVYDSKVGACNHARTVARHSNMEYIGCKVKLTD